MSIRKEVFQAKVLKKLYPAPAQPKLEKVICPPPPTTKVKSVAQQTSVITKSIIPVKSNGDGERPALAGRKLYTVLPPPEGYRSSAELPVADPAPGSDAESEEADDVQTEEPRRKRRRKKKTSEVPADGSEGKECVTGSEVNSVQASTAERLSRNRKRKLKKKRHKEKLRSLGLAPHASAVEFTYQHKENAEEEEEQEEQEEDKTEDKEEDSEDEKAAKVLEFLKNTLETYTSDRSSPEREPPSGADALLNSFSDGTAPPGELTRLCGLKELVLRRDVGELRGALEEFRSSTAMPLEQASAVCTLLHYWITDIFPLDDVLKT